MKRIMLAIVFLLLVLSGVGYTAEAELKSGWICPPKHESPVKSRKSAKTSQIMVCNMLISLRSHFAEIPDLDFLQGTQT